MNGQAIHVLARQLVDEGYLDNEPDALLAAIEIMMAAQELQDLADSPSTGTESLPGRASAGSARSVGYPHADAFRLVDSPLLP